ncbi:GntR family transcriptional regulator [Clostridium chauvoei]|uniref:GntR family transcriptional regulator n=2 Tax=Clostridium chauvoei TaxID=46867 RepID=A0ABD4RHU2_9CLOT|nr:GntR family transcriptional regulator [Clostridium chauvoei]ATD55591.1 GntR family transcriptional regulator [Clostridium chauvoei]ATD56732.1 GntR family transcriptional regulator [Clostridium chauvoei]MBX7280962.1 GntR family transcriptional regulator [Clostridium chauvoei]MBX7283429.1 GntR family transcriptional regulator [Clostridium chauvoei]MBX7285994.1 GntR family transcriptional regulator [Clostridium chauvoei]
MKLVPKNSKKLLYTLVYDNLYKMIINGEYPINSKLPSEPQLAKMFGVSRMTLRQALSLLQDDGLVKNIHGKGNFITSPEKCNKKDFLELIGNPIYKYHNEPINDVELFFRLDLESDYTRQVLEKTSTAVVACERYYKSNNKVIAYAFTFISIETILEMNIDLNNKDQLLDFLENKAYEVSTSSMLEIKRSTAGNTNHQRHKLVGGEQCDLILETLYLNDYSPPLLFNKYYIPYQYSNFRIKATRKI